MQEANWKATVKSGRCANWGYWLRLSLPAHAGVDVPKSAYKNGSDNDLGGAHALIAVACCIGVKERDREIQFGSALLFARRSAASMKLIHTHIHRQAGNAVCQYTSMSNYQLLLLCSIGAGVGRREWGATRTPKNGVAEISIVRKGKPWKKRQTIKRRKNRETKQMSNQKRRENKDENGDGA